jgi:hypothetical protein
LFSLDFLTCNALPRPRRVRPAATGVVASISRGNFAALNGASMFSDYNPQDFLPVIGVGGMAGAAVIAGTAAMSYYAPADASYRYQSQIPGSPDASDNLLGDMRTQVLLASLLAGPFAAARGMYTVAGVLGVLGTSAMFSLVSSEGQRWAESGEYFGISLPALPAMKEDAAAIAAPQEPATAADAISGMHYGRMHY